MGRRLRQRICPGNGCQGGCSHVSAVWPDKGMFWAADDAGVADDAGAGNDPGAADDCAGAADDAGAVDCAGAGAAVSPFLACARWLSPSGARSASKSRKRWSGKPWLSVTVPQTRTFLPACMSQGGRSGSEKPCRHGLPYSCHCAVSSPASASSAQKASGAACHRRLSARNKRKK